MASNNAWMVWVFVGAVLLLGCTQAPPNEVPTTTPHRAADAWPTSYPAATVNPDQPPALPVDITVTSPPAPSAAATSPANSPTPNPAEDLPPLPE